MIGAQSLPLRRSGSYASRPHSPEWRNWQTQRIQNPPGFTALEGSSPSSGTNNFAQVRTRSLFAADVGLIAHFGLRTAPDPTTSERAVAQRVAQRRAGAARERERQPWRQARCAQRTGRVVVKAAVVEHAQIPAEKALNSIQWYGNTTAATVPLTIDHWRQHGKVKPGDLVLSTVFGSGYTWGVAIFGV